MEEGNVCRVGVRVKQGAMPTIRLKTAKVLRRKLNPTCTIRSLLSGTS